MSAHLNRDSLWDLASAANLPADAKAHLASCGDCQVQLAQVKQAQKVLQLRAAPAAVLDPIAARRIGARLKEAAEQELAPSRWWRFSFGPSTGLRTGWAIAGVAAVVLAILVWSQAQVAPEPMPVARHEVPAPAPAPQLAEKPPAPAPAPKLLAKVTGAKKARSADGKLQKTQTLTEGSQVATEPGGSLWLALPDGSRAGLTGATAMKLDTLEEKHLGFTLEKGNVMMVARHLPGRLMTVKAGEVEVRDVGTRFLVSRDVDRVLVAVEEGVVEIKVPGTQMTLKAGRSVEWREGQLREQAWAPPTPPIPPKVEIASPPTPAIDAIAQKPVPAPALDGDPEEEWGKPPNPPKPTAPAPVAAPPVPVPEQPPIYEAPPPAEDEQGSESLLSKLEQRLNKVKRVVQAPFNALGASLRETRAREVGQLADEGSCEEALKRADSWLAEKPSVSEAEPRWKRSVMVNQMRCYTRLKRDADAARVKQKLE